MLFVRNFLSQVFRIVRFLLPCLGQSLFNQPVQSACLVAHHVATETVLTYAEYASNFRLR